MKVTFIGLTITSSWGNGHATTFRSLIKGLHHKGHDVLFLERDVPYYASNRDMPNPPYCRLGLYDSTAELMREFQSDVRDSDLVVVGSFVPDGIEIGKWVLNTARGVTAFYDIDTPVTMSKLDRRECEYIDPELIRGYNIYFSFSGGTVLDYIENKYGARRALPLYCSVDTDLYYPEADTDIRWDLGYLGTYSEDRHPPLDALLITVAGRQPKGRFVVAGPQYPDDIQWPQNVERIDHLSPDKHRNFYNSQRFTLNVTRRDMIDFGYSPSVRLFEAAACGVPIISDRWKGMDEFFTPDQEIFLVSGTEDVLSILTEVSEEQRNKMGSNAREKICDQHSSIHRAVEFERAVAEVIQQPNLSQ